MENDLDDLTGKLADAEVTWDNALKRKANAEAVTNKLKKDI